MGPSGVGWFVDTSGAASPRCLYFPDVPPIIKLRQKRDIELASSVSLTAILSYLSEEVREIATGYSLLMHLNYPPPIMRKGRQDVSM
jgi:hypothetical protein